MSHVRIDLENCYGIKKLKYDFDFSEGAVYAIYAPNGAMKSSLAQTFLDMAEGKSSSDRIYATRVNKRVVTNGNNKELDKRSILVVRPYVEELGTTEDTCTLLVNPAMRKEYAGLIAEINAAKATLLAALRDQAKAPKRDFEYELTTAFASPDYDTALGRIRTEVEDQKDCPFKDVDYDTVFDDKVITVLEEKDIKSAIEDYGNRYNELLAASKYFKKGTFDYYNAGMIAKNLADNGFFDAHHTLNLVSGTSLLIKTQKDLEAVIEKEKKEILTDPKLRAQFNAVAKKFEKNIPLRDFVKYMLNHESLLSRMSDIVSFKQDVLKSYIKARLDLYRDLMTKKDKAKDRIEKITEEAKKESTQWEEVIQVFNRRFTVPFKLSASNKEAVMLGYAKSIDVEFNYNDGTESATIQRESLLKSLSNGEKKALYILGILFDVQVRKTEGRETLMIVDDLADSFDYQNKYAIIQYLRDINEDKLFKQIIMTHNFDFFRTLESRFVDYDNCLMAARSDDGTLSLEKATGIKGKFLDEWRQHFTDDPKKKISCIPFVRNLIEFSTGATGDNYNRLTSLLHWKDDSEAITVSDLDNIFNTTFNLKKTSPDGSSSVIALIHTQAELCKAAPAGVNFENKIVLAIAIRLAAEKFIIDKLKAADSFGPAITKNQTQVLVERFKKQFNGDPAGLILDRVALMTPENIHLNSFMYEPIVDMSDGHLRQLYIDVKALK